jgi:hypothetical protein
MWIPRVIPSLILPGTMSYKHIARSSGQAAISSGRGCLSGYLLPPLAVICVGIVQISFALGSRTPARLADYPPDKGIKIHTNGTIKPLSPVFTPEVQYWATKIQDWAETAELDLNLVATVMQIESCGDPKAHSRAGAMGLFQVMPFHFTPGDDPYSPSTNARRGLDYLKRSLETAKGNTRLALAGYNGGIGVITWSESDWPEETRRYAYWGSGIYDETSSGTNISLRLQDWLEANGKSLCRQAHARLGIIP